MSFNKIIIQGNLGKDAETVTNNSNTYYRLTVATSETWKDKQTQEKKEKTTWHTCYLFGNYANLIPYLTKGKPVLVEGSQEHNVVDLTHNNNVVELDGKILKRTISYIKVRSIQLVGGGTQAAQSAQAAQPAQQSQPAQQAQPNQNSDLPF